MTMVTSGRTTSQKNACCANDLMASSVEIAHVVEEQRRGVRQAVDAVQDAAVPRQNAAAVLDAEIALHGGDDDVANEAADADERRGAERLQSRKRRERRRQQSAEHDGRSHS